MSMTIRGTLRFIWPFDIPDEELVKLLIQNGVDVNMKGQNGMTALHWVAFRKSPLCTKLLIDAGADVNVRQNDGGTPLYHMVGNADEETLRLLLRAKADPNTECKPGYIPYSVALPAAETGSLPCSLITAATLIPVVALIQPP
jgi:ankyrin repeat protein